MNMFGLGSYFAREARLSQSYAAEIFDAADLADGRACRALLLCAVLHDELVVGQKGVYPPPRKPHSASGARYSATADRVFNPSVVVTYNDGQALPLYIVTYDGR